MEKPSIRNSPTFSPLYRQIKELLTQSLENGEWSPGEMIPSEYELASRFGVSQGTVRKAIDELAAENLLVRRQGKGTFVASHNDPRAFFRFLRLAPNEGALPPLKSVPVQCWRAKASAEAAKALGLPLGAPVIVIRRLLKFNSEPVVFDEIHLPAAIYDDLTLEVLASGATSLYSLFETRYGVRMIRAAERLRAVSADRLCAEMLLVEEGTPLLLVERVTYTYGDKPVEWRRGFYSTENYFYRNDLS